MSTWDDERDGECPYCGYSNGSLWEYFGEGGDGEVADVECWSCERTFRLVQHVHVDYTSSPMPARADEAA